MNMMARSAETVVDNKVTLSVLIREVAAAVARHPMNNLGGIERIEELHSKDVADLPIAGTLFEIIAQQQRLLGKTVDDTVGGVMEAFGLERYSDTAAYWAHEVGCNCHGPFVSPDAVSARILNMGKAIA